jgi:Rieske Fe-S protein
LASFVIQALTVHKENTGEKGGISVADEEKKNNAVSEGRVDLKRRKLIALAAGSAGAVWVGASIYPLYRYLAPQPVPDPFGESGRAKVDLIAPSDVAAPGSGKNGAYGGRGLIVLRTEDGTLKAFDAKCTHAGCNVEFQTSKLFCNCHGGVYDFGGRNVSGPPPKPLTELAVVEENGALYVSPLKGDAGKA